MSWRTRQRARAAPLAELQVQGENLVVNHDNVKTEYAEDLTPYDDGSYPANLLPGGERFPGPVEYFHTGADATPYTYTPVGVIRDNIDWEIGGESGDANGYLWSTGVVDPNTVENFDLTGQQQIIRRMADTNYGPVATADHNALLAMAYAQQMNQFYPSEESQYDLIRGV